MPDVRVLLLAAAGWCGALVALLAPATVTVGVLAAAGVVGLAWMARHGWSPLAACLVLSTSTVALVALVHGHGVSSSPTAELAGRGAVVDLRLRVTSDPRPGRGAHGEVLVLSGEVLRVAGRGRAWRDDAPVVVIADADWPAPALGTTITTAARLGPADGDAAALVRPVGVLQVLYGPDVWWRAAAAVRRSVRDVVADRGADARELVPALVDGDDAGISPELADDFRATGLTHLLAVSGTNLTILVGFLLIVGRWVGVRGRGLWALGAFGIVGFVLVARTEPSVVRAAAMGSVALIGMGANGTSRGTRCLGVAALVLLLADPGLALSAGFALSVLATGGILLLAPRWRDAMMAWAPRWLAEAVSVPLAAQVACTPVVLGISGEVSLVAVWANLVVAPAVAPATVLGLAGGLAGLAWPRLGEWIAAPGAWAVEWIILVARRAADLPTAAVELGATPLVVVLVTAATVVVAAVMPRVVGRRSSATLSALVLVAAVLVRPPTPGWPPADWVMAACDVGQGDALLLNAGGGSAVLVDAGPDPEALAACLRRLEVRVLPVVVVTHFHADHVDGVRALGDRFRVGQVLGSSLPDPPAGVALVSDTVAAPGVTPYGASWRLGELTVQHLWPPPHLPPVSSSESAANNASVVLLVESRGVRMLLTGDLEPSGQRALARSLPDLDVDVLKVPHHGSRHQDLDWLTSLSPEVAIVSVGEDNDYGHPDAGLLSALERVGAETWRTDESGDVVVVVDGDGLAVRGRH